MAVEVRWGDGIMTGVCMLCCQTSLVLLSSVQMKKKKKKKSNLSSSSNIQTHSVVSPVVLLIVSYCFLNTTDIRMHTQDQCQDHVWHQFKCGLSSAFFILAFFFVFCDCSQIIFVDSNLVVMHLDPVYQRLRVFITWQNPSKNFNDKIFALKKGQRLEWASDW